MKEDRMYHYCGYRIQRFRGRYYIKPFSESFEKTIDYPIGRQEQYQTVCRRLYSRWSCGANSEQIIETIKAWRDEGFPIDEKPMRSSLYLVGYTRPAKIVLPENQEQVINDMREKINEQFKEQYPNEPFLKKENN